MRLPDESSHQPQPYFSLSKSEFEYLAQKAKRDFGLNLKEDKKELVRSRLSKRLRALKISSFAEYCAILKSPRTQQEAIQMLSALTTNVTHFFREMHHFNAFEEEIMPELGTKVLAGERVRIWSAGCSAGQEPYSIAASILANFPEIHRYDFKILATDVDPNILEIAKKGKYGTDEIDSIKEPYKAILFGSVKCRKMVVEKSVSDLITFGQLNLVSDWPMSGSFDVIFCRNVAIYFDKKTQEHLWSRLYGILNPGGTLMIGHSERLSGPIEKRFESTGITMYRRKID